MGRLGYGVMGAGRSLDDGSSAWCIEVSSASDADKGEGVTESRCGTMMGIVAGRWVPVAAPTATL